MPASTHVQTKRWQKNKRKKKYMGKYLGKFAYTAMHAKIKARRRKGENKSYKHKNQPAGQATRATATLGHLNVRERSFHRQHIQMVYACIYIYTYIHKHIVTHICAPACIIIWVTKAPCLFMCVCVCMCALAVYLCKGLEKKIKFANNTLHTLHCTIVVLIQAQPSGLVGGGRGTFRRLLPLSTPHTRISAYFGGKSHVYSNGKDVIWLCDTNAQTRTHTHAYIHSPAGCHWWRHLTFFGNVACVALFSTLRWCT